MAALLAAVPRASGRAAALWDRARTKLRDRPARAGSSPYWTIPGNSRKIGTARPEFDVQDVVGVTRVKLHRTGYGVQLPPRRAGRLELVGCLVIQSCASAGTGMAPGRSKIRN